MVNRSVRQGSRLWNRLARAAVAAATAVALSVGAAEARQLLVQSVFPSGMLFQSDSEQAIVDRTAAVSGGDLTLSFVGAGGLVRGEELFAAVQDGRVDAAWDWIGYRAAEIPLAGVIASYPFGPSPQHLIGWLYGGGGNALLARAYAAHGLTVLPCQAVMAEPGGWFLREINGPEDFQGLRMRIAGLGARVVERLGGVPSNEPVDGLFDALSGGRLDAVEFSVPMADLSLGFAHFAHYYYFPGWHQPASLNVLMMRTHTWNSLTQRQRDILETVCRANLMTTLTTGLAPQAAALDIIRAQGVEVRRFDDSVLAALQAASREVLAEASAGDPLVAEAVRSLTAYTESLRRWESLQALPP